MKCSHALVVLLLIASQWGQCGIERRRMKKCIFLFVAILAFNSVSCGSSVKKGMEESSSEGVVNAQTEDTTVYKVTKFVIPKYSENVNIYKSSSKTSHILVFEECMEEGEDNCGNLKWVKSKSEGGTNVIPASKDFVFWYNVNVLPVISEEKDWYKVYVRLDPKSRDDKVIGFIPREDCIDAVTSNISLSDIQNDCKELYVYCRDNNYVKWGLEIDGYVMYVGKIIDGKALESNEIDCHPEYGNVSGPNKLVVANANKKYEFSNKKYFTKDLYDQYNADFSKFSNEDFNKVLSLSENEYPNIYIKIRDISELYLIRDGDIVDGRKIVWNY